VSPSRCQRCRQQAKEVPAWLRGGQVFGLRRSCLQQRRPYLLVEGRPFRLGDRADLKGEVQPVTPADSQVREDAGRARVRSIGLHHFPPFGCL
jgi:hypothetical protein